MTATRPDVGAPEQAGWATELVRTSGLLLFVLLAVHVLQVYLLNDIEAETLQTFTERWSNPVWRAVDWGLVVLGLVHGTLGLRPIVSSSALGARTRGVVLGVLYGLVGILLATVTFVAFTFRFA